MAAGEQDRQTRFTWDKASQNLTLDLSSEPARKRYFLKLFITLVAAIVFAAMVFGVVWLVRERQQGVVILEVEEPPEPPLLVVNGNVSIPEQMIRDMVEDEVSVGLKKLNLFTVKKTLEQSGQILNAELTKDFPDQLLIYITERQPILMLATQREGEEVVYWGVDENGVLFKPYDLRRMKVLDLPYLKVASLKETIDGQTTIPGMQKIHYLLELLKRDAYPVYDDIRWVSLEQYEDGEAELGAVIILEGRQIGRIIFGVDHFENQVTKLISVLSVSGNAPLNKKEIDLSYDGDAIIR